VCRNGASTAKRGPCSESAFAAGIVKRDKARARIAAAINRIFLITLQKTISSYIPQGRLAWCPIPS